MTGPKDDRIRGSPQYIWVPNCMGTTSTATTVSEYVIKSASACLLAWLMFCNLLMVWLELEASHEDRMCCEMAVAKEEK